MPGKNEIFRHTPNLVLVNHVIVVVVHILTLIVIAVPLLISNVILVIKQDISLQFAVVVKTFIAHKIKTLSVKPLLEITAL